MIIVDEASHRDIDSIATLLGALFAQEAEFSANAAKQKAGLKLILSDPTVGRIFLARENDVVIGMVNLLFSVSTALGQRVAILDDLIVTEAYRRRGLGKILMDAAIKFCRDQELARIVLQTDADNFVAQRLYESRGFVQSQMISYKKLL